MKTTTYKDHLKEVYEEFDQVDEVSIRAIVRHGLSRLAFFKTNGVDIFLANKQEDLYYYMGDHTDTRVDHQTKKDKKHRKKLRILHSLRKLPYEGYYYVGLTEEQQATYLLNNALDDVTLY